MTARLVPSRETLDFHARLNPLACILDIEYLFDALLRWDPSTKLILNIHVPYSARLQRLTVKAPWTNCRTSPVNQTNYLCRHIPSPARTVP